MSPTNEGRLAANSASLLIGQQLLVPFVRGEPDGHLGNDTSQNGTQTLVQTQSGLLLHDINTSGQEPARFDLQKHENVSNCSNILQLVLHKGENSPREL